MLINGQGDKKPRYSKPRFLSWPNSTLLHWPGTRVNSKTHAHSPHNWPTQWLYPTDPLRTQNWKHFRVLSAPFLAEGMGMLCGNWGGERIQSGVTTLFLYRWWLSMQGESVVTAITLLCMRLWGTTLHVGGGRGSVHLLRVMVSKALPCPPPRHCLSLMELTTEVQRASAGHITHYISPRPLCEKSLPKLLFCLLNSYGKMG